MAPVGVRRLLITPLWLAMTALLVVLSPALLLLALAATVIVGRRQPLLILRFSLAYLVREAGVIVACAGLWLASGFGRDIASERFRSLHYKLLHWFLGGVLAEIATTLDLHLDEDPTDAADRALRDHDGPLLVFCRHAGPADSFLIVYLLLDRYGRLPHIVMKRMLALDPCIDLVTNRLPNALLDTSDPAICEAQIAALARGLDVHSALILFPEGGNFTAQRRQRAVARLWRSGRPREASRAEKMLHVMPPKPTGVLAALAANPSADVVFVAQTGLGPQTFLRELWKHVPTDETLRIRFWLARAATRPRDPQDQIDWLYAWWKRIDEWIDALGTEPLPAEPQRP